MSTTKLLIPNREVQLIGYVMSEVTQDTIKKDLTLMKSLLEGCSYNPKTTFSFERQLIKVQYGKLSIKGHALDPKGKIYKINLDYGHNVPRFCELLAYTCKFYTMYFIVVTDANVGGMEKVTVGHGVSWGSEFFWTYIA